jgi:hypothetical protein
MTTQDRKRFAELKAQWLALDTESQQITINAETEAPIFCTPRREAEIMVECQMLVDEGVRLTGKSNDEVAWHFMKGVA